MAEASPLWLADWPAPPGVRAFTTMRHGAGGSLPPFDSFNLGNRTAADGDDPVQVQRNRDALQQLAKLPSAPHWLRQVHSSDALRFDAPPLAQGLEAEPTADASVTSVAGVVLAILTADCLPVVFAARDGSEVAAAHAGWGGLARGMLENTLAAMHTPAEALVAWIGPAAGPALYEVGVDVREAFLAHSSAAESHFVATRAGWPGSGWLRRACRRRPSMAVTCAPWPIRSAGSRTGATVAAAVSPPWSGWSDELAAVRAGAGPRI